jgi:hypothetical protein
MEISNIYSLTPSAPIPACEYDLRGVDQIAGFVGIPVDRMRRLLDCGFPARKLDGEWAARSHHLQRIGFSAEVFRAGGAA